MGVFRLLSFQGGEVIFNRFFSFCFLKLNNQTLTFESF
jgi:hypothetical protein